MLCPICLKSLEEELTVFENATIKDVYLAHVRSSDVVLTQSVTWFILPGADIQTS